MADTRPQQFWRKTALVLATSLFVAFGTAALLIIQKRPMDERAIRMIAIMGAGAFFGCIASLILRRMIRTENIILRFVLTFLVAGFCILLCQGMLTGLEFYVSSYAVHDPFTVLGGWLELAFTSLSGFAYFYVFGLDSFWPAVAAAAALFALGAQTLHIHDRT